MNNELHVVRKRLAIDMSQVSDLRSPKRRRKEENQKRKKLQKIECISIPKKNYVHLQGTDTTLFLVPVPQEQNNFVLIPPEK